jgi:CDP-paratose 2-epimerase
MVPDISLNSKGMEHAINNVGLVQWFHINQHREVERVVEDFEKLGIDRISSGRKGLV